MLILLFSCKREHFYWDNVNEVVEDIVFSFIDQEKVYFTQAGSWGTTNYGRDLDKMFIDILFNKGSWNDLLVYNENIENEIANKVYNTFLNLNKDKDVLKYENIKVKTYYPFMFIFPNGIILSNEEKEILEDIMWEEFEMHHVITIKENYCEGWIENNIDFDKFINIIKVYFDQDFILEM